MKRFLKNWFSSQIYAGVLVTFSSATADGHGFDALKKIDELKKMAFINMKQFLWRMSTVTFTQSRSFNKLWSYMMIIKSRKQIQTDRNEIPLFTTLLFPVTKFHFFNFWNVRLCYIAVLWYPCDTRWWCGTKAWRETETGSNWRKRSLVIGERKSRTVLKVTTVT